MNDPKWNGPPAISVYCTITPNQRNQLSEIQTFRIGTCKTEGEVASIIRKDLKAMAETFGGLFTPTDTQGRHYRAFRASWTEIKVNLR